MAGSKQSGVFAGRTILGISPVALMLAAVPALALPPDPQRLFEARTCEEAQARHAEAQEGSPLISSVENAAVLRQAEAQMRRLCGPETSIQNPEKSWNRPKHMPTGFMQKGNVSCRS